MVSDCSGSGRSSSSTSSGSNCTTAAQLVLDVLVAFIVPTGVPIQQRISCSLFFQLQTVVAVEALVIIV